MELNSEILDCSKNRSLTYTGAGVLKGAMVSLLGVSRRILISDFNLLLRQN